MENVESQHEKLVSKSTFPIVVLFNCAIQRARDVTTESKNHLPGTHCLFTGHRCQPVRKYPDLRSDQERRGRGGENACDLVP